jgi:hypothetical protein
MNKYYCILLGLVIFSCFTLIAESVNKRKNIVEWKFLSIDSNDRAALTELNKDIVIVIALGESRSENKYAEREIKLQKKTKLYQEIITHANNNKKDNSTTLIKENHNIQAERNFSCFVAGVFLPEMSLALKKGNIALFSERFEQILYILPITNNAYSFVVAPLFALIPQCAYYSNVPEDTTNHLIKIIKNLLMRYKIIINKSKPSTSKLYFLKKNIISLETLLVNLFLMDFYQKNQRWPDEDSVKKIPLFFASKLNYRSINGAFSYKLFFKSLKMKSEVNGLLKEKNEKLIIKKVMELQPFKITPID